jgi:hypothetical protein
VSLKVPKEIPDSEEKIYKLLQGLVKIQALMRGYLARKRLEKTMPPRIRVQMT